MNLAGIRVLMTVISASIGACFVLIAWFSIRAAVAPVRRFHIASVVIAAVAVGLACLAFRAAALRDTDEETLFTSLRSGMVGAFLGLIAVSSFLFLYGDTTRAILAHAFSRPTSAFTTSPMLIASALLGFAIGFVIRTVRARGLD